jgi:hypothetical protein
MNKEYLEEQAVEFQLYAEEIHIDKDLNKRYSTIDRYGVNMTVPELLSHYKRVYGDNKKAKVFIKRVVKEKEREIHVGWIFTSKTKYKDSDELYTREVWVTLYNSMKEGDYHKIQPIRSK